MSRKKNWMLDACLSINFPPNMLFYCVERWGDNACGLFFSLSFCSFALEQYWAFTIEGPVADWTWQSIVEKKKPAQQLYTYVWTYTVVVVDVAPIKQMSVEDFLPEELLLLLVKKGFCFK